MKRNSNGWPTASGRRRFCQLATVEPLRVRKSDTVRQVSAGLTVFRIAADGHLMRIRKYDVATGNDRMVRCGTVPLGV